MTLLTFANEMGQKWGMQVEKIQYVQVYVYVGRKDVYVYVGRKDVYVYVGRKDIVCGKDLAVYQVEKL